MEDKQFTERDLYVAQELGAIKGGIDSLNRVVRDYITSHSEDHKHHREEHNTLWKKLDKTNRIVVYLLILVAGGALATGITNGSMISIISSIGVP